jgi:hypothetical protein
MSVLTGRRNDAAWPTRPDIVSGLETGVPTVADRLDYDAGSLLDATRDQAHLAMPHCRACVTVLLAPSPDPTASLGHPSMPSTPAGRHPRPHHGGATVSHGDLVAAALHAGAEGAVMDGAVRDIDPMLG